MTPDGRPDEQPIERIRTLLRSDALDMEFQPIFDLQAQEIVGVEALARFRMQPLRSPDAWFREAAAVGLGTEVEMVAVRRALDALPHLSPDSMLSLNASPSTIASEQFFETLVNRAVDRIVVEAKEAALVRNESVLQRAIERLRGIGVRLAVDDVRNDGESFAGILRMAPEFVKLDISLCRYIDLDEGRSHLVHDLVDLALEAHADVIAEGIQSRTELETLRGVGVRYGQGYYLALPSRLPLAGTAVFAHGVTVTTTSAPALSQRSA
ncbi:MAG TPA: EAL domain-containing protein [Actinomycetota bacterium]|nr:EAL domain-containing protein [Actinomycetota bacterium]